MTEAERRAMAERIVDNRMTTGNGGRYCPCCGTDDGWWDGSPREARIAQIIDLLELADLHLPMRS